MRLTKNFRFDQRFKSSPTPIGMVFFFFVLLPLQIFWWIILLIFWFYYYVAYFPLKWFGIYAWRLYKHYSENKKQKTKIIEEKVANKEIVEDIKEEIVEDIKDKNKDTSNKNKIKGDISETILNVFLCICFPPVAIYKKTKNLKHVYLNIFLVLTLIVPGIVHAFILTSKYKSKK